MIFRENNKINPARSEMDKGLLNMGHSMLKNSRIFVYVMEKKELKINADKTSWYVLYTAPRAEKQVRDRINALGVECWLPLHRAPRV